MDRPYLLWIWLPIAAFLGAVMALLAGALGVLEYLLRDH